MALNPEHLLTFVRVARHGNLSAAAVELNLTQPAVSNQIKLLTQAVGEPLLTRHRYGVRLTPTGQGLLPHAVAAERALIGATRYAADLRGLETGTLNIAASSTIAAALLPEVLAQYHARFPGVTLRVQQGNTQEVLAALMGGACELALIEGAAGALPADLTRRTFARDTLRLVVAPQHPLAQHQALTSAHLSGLGLVWRELGSGTREVAWAALERAGIVTQDVLTLTGSEAVKEAVISGLGAAFLSELIVRRELASGVLVGPRVHLPGLSRNLEVVSASPELLSSAVQVFVTLLRPTG
ncbi:LysR family transcriptional regulator [Deinococcus humi]|uniref:DNA-binding transcriptional LysR family regulator n=1 Tax=Deinococcus humi TaxID=662880 RepID=A0A7W8JU07_9DEIO|nr:LysR substrate-binding domain-containing protein [Deinococcus humi]MBB5362783.1 DNA-binding transcriptional LysR family regulator [Deinococcus humi]GGO26263.1 LysR family transcriptional regulator [Deinococcus humi]